MIEVLASGFYSTIQDLGRFGYGEIGIPVSGVMDADSAGFANAILGNNPNDATLEITLGKCELLFHNQTIICISGADLESRLNSISVTLNTAIKVNKGDRLSFNKPVLGVRSYLAVKGGFQTNIVLNSRSFYNGITNENTMKKGAVLPAKILKIGTEKAFSSVKVSTAHFTSKIVEAYEGPEYHLLNQMQKRKLKEAIFTISKDNNRMGYRLEQVLENNLESMLTSAVMPGTVQLTPAGKLIVLMRDCQVTGGYPRVLQITDEAINILAQKTTGDVFTFKIVSLI